MRAAGNKIHVELEYLTDHAITVRCNLAEVNFVVPLLSTVNFFLLNATLRPIFDILMFCFPENQTILPTRLKNRYTLHGQIKTSAAKGSCMIFWSSDLIPKKNCGSQTSRLLDMVEIISSEILFAIVNYVDLTNPISERISKCWIINIGFMTWVTVTIKRRGFLVTQCILELATEPLYFLMRGP